MTIEAGSAQGAARPAAANDSRNVKSKQGDSAGGGGFTAVLASVETAQTAAPAVSDASATGKNVAAKPQGKAKAAANATNAAQPDADPSAGEVGGQDHTATAVDDVSTKSAADDPQAGDPTAAAVLAMLSGVSDPKAGTDAPMDAAALLAQSGAWGAGAKNSAVAVAGQNPPVGANGLVMSATGPRAAPVLASATTGAAVSPELSADQLAEGLQKAAKLNADAKTKSLVVSASPAETTVLPDGKALAVNQKATTDLHMAPTLATEVASAAVAANLRREDQPRERSVFRSNTSSEGAVAPQALSTATPTLTVSSSPEVIASTDAFVAEKVSYWISNNVQNAEMKLDGIGDRPVEVSIRMHGNEAHVAFRTDELQTRAALENASVHLKDMLQREGLVLSGVSVGTAGTGDSGTQDRQPRQGARQTTVATLLPVGGDLSGVSNRVTRGGLDLFV